MSKLVWNTNGDRYYETGIDKGVFYPPLESGIAWNGLISVTETAENAGVKSFYLEGIKYLEVANNEEFSGSIEAYYPPQGFYRFDGTYNVGNSLFITQQPKRSFGFSYRTKVGNDTIGENYSYKIHLVYNLLAISGDKTYKTLADSPETLIHNWSFTTVPELIKGLRPAAHLIVTPAKPTFIAAVEEILYGTASTQPRLPSPAELLELNRTT